MSDLRDKSWRELCEAVTCEHDPEKLLELVTALSDVLERAEQEKKANLARRTGRGEKLPDEFYFCSCPQEVVPL